MIDEKENLEQQAASEASQELAHCKDALAKAHEQMRYLQADFENFRRNVTRERVQWARVAQTPLLEDLITLADDLERALAQMKKDDAQGIELVYKNLMGMLAKQGVTVIPATGVFDPALHEAIAQVEAEGKEPGTVVQLLQKGYMHKETVLRPAKVSVAK